MKMWTTSFEAVNIHNGKLETFHGPHIPGEDIEDAIRYCVNNQLYYLMIGSQFVEEIEVTQKEFLQLPNHP